MPEGDPDTAKLVAVLSAHRIDLVVDIGANVGQYATRLRAAGFAGRIVSVEPQAALHPILAAAAAADPLWTIAPPMALGGRDGTATFHVSRRSDMSSLYAQTATTREAMPKAADAGVETVEIRRLAGALDAWAPAGARGVVKVDAQGAESEILDGAEAAIGRILGWQMELSLVPMYEHETLYLPLMQRLDALGYAAHLVLPGFFSKTLARQMQFDAVFMRPEAAA